MGHNSHIDFDLNDAITDLVDRGWINPKSPAYGIAQQVITSGYGSLTEKQIHVYDTYVVPELRKRQAEIEAIRIQNSNID